MSNYINLTDIVELEKLQIIERYQQEPAFVTEVTIRGKTLRYTTQSKRQLWQAVGLEYIEPELLDYIDSLPVGSTFFDIGASTGIFSIYAKNSGLKVFAFEPEAQNFSLLEKNSFLNFSNRQGGLLTFNIALADSIGLGKMYIAAYEAAGHMKILDTPRKVQDTKDFEAEYIQNVIRLTLDYIVSEFSLPVPNHIKIDVDGSELALIRGASATLKNENLKSIFIELAEPSEDTDIIKSILANHGFKMMSKHQVQNYEGLNNYIFGRD